MDYIMQQLRFISFVQTLLFLFLHKSSASFPLNWCSPANSSFPANFKINLGDAYSRLVPDTSTSLDSYASVGKYPETVYAQFMCLDYKVTSNCSKCVSEAYTGLQSTCPSATEAIMWRDTCQFRYSHHKFIGRLDLSHNDSFGNQWNWSNLSYFDTYVTKGVEKLIRDAAYANPKSKNATAKIESPEGEPVSALAQCTNDLSSDQCHKCLQVGFRSIAKRFRTKRGARFISFSCYLRYELYEFYNGETEANNNTNNFAAQSPKSNHNVRVFVAIAIALGFSLLLIGAIACIVVRKRKKIHEIRWKHSPLMELSAIVEATDNFSPENFIGRGSFGSVYKGILRDGREVAVKKLSYESELKLEEFKNEVVLIMKLQHKNLVRLLGFCVYGLERLLVYEYLCNGSLDHFLRDPVRRKEMNWMTRVKMIQGVAHGMLYLHQDSRVKIIHRDLKCSNILLDDGMNPKISDFGIAKIFVGDKDANSTSIIIGTFGYLAPEYAMGGQYSVKSDVFSFGVVILEIITGRLNIASRNSDLIQLAWRLWNEGDDMELMDSVFTAGSCPYEEFSRYIHIGLLCIQEEANDRPTMSDLIKMLNNETADLSQPGKPPLATDTRQLRREWSNSHLTLSDIAPR